jgi:hypothetical protein
MDTSREDALSFSLVLLIQNGGVATHLEGLEDAAILCCPATG